MEKGKRENRGGTGSPGQFVLWFDWIPQGSRPPSGRSKGAATPKISFRRVPVKKPGVNWAASECDYSAGRMVTATTISVSLSRAVSVGWGIRAITAVEGRSLAPISMIPPTRTPRVWTA